MTRHRFASLGLLFGIAALVPIACLAQAPIPGGIASGSISLEIVDAAGNSMPGVTLEARDVASGTTFTVVTDSSGRIRIPKVPPGTYQVRASLEGFTSVTQSVTVSTGQAVTVQLMLGGPVPGGIGSGASGGIVVGGSGTPPASPSRVVEVVSKTTDDDVALQQLLNDRAAAGWLLASTVPMADRTTLFVFYKSPAAVACLAQVVTRPLAAADLKTRLAQLPAKRFRGIHRLTTNTYAIVLCEE